MVAYFILVHRYPAQFARMMRAAYDERNSYVIHIDKRSGPEFAAEIRDILRAYPKAEVIPAQAALWGGYSLVDAELRGMQKLLEMRADWKYFINLSGQDFPLKSQQYVHDFLTAHAGCEFIRASDQRKTRPDTLNRIHEMFVEGKDTVMHTGITRAFLPNATPYIGTQWKAVSRGFCKFVTADPQALRFKNFYRQSFIADEAFFQTVMMNAGQHGKMMNNDLPTIEWVPDGPIKLRPRNFGRADMPMLAASPDLFARKFDQTQDPLVLELLEAHLKTPAARLYKRPQTPPISMAHPQHVFDSEPELAVVVA